MLHTPFRLALLAMAAFPIMAHAQGAPRFDTETVAGQPSEAPQGRIMLPDPVRRNPGEPVTDFASALELTAHLPGLLAEQSRERASLARIDQASAAFGPSLDAEASYGYARDRFDTGLGRTVTQSGFSARARATLSQILFSSGQLTASLRGAQAERELQRQSRRLTENQALLSSVEAYIGLQRSIALLAIARENLTLLAEQERNSSARYEQRELTTVDYDQVRARLQASRAELASAEAGVNTARARFFQAIGAPPGELAPAPAPLALMPPSLEEAQAAAAEESPLIIAAHARERVSREQLHGARGSLGPVVSLEGTADRNSQSPYNNALNQTQLRGAVTVRMPVYDSGQRVARIEETRALNDADARLIDQADRDTQYGVQESWERYSAGQRSIASLRDASKAAESAYNGIIVQERAGLVTTLDVLIVLRDLLQVRSQLVNAEADTQVARYALLSAMGRLEFARMNIAAPPPGDIPATRRVSQAYTLPIGPAARIVDSIAGGPSRKPPRSRDKARTIKLLDMTDPLAPVPADDSISAQGMR